MDELRDMAERFDMQDLKRDLGAGQGTNTVTFRYDGAVMVDPELHSYTAALVVAVRLRKQLTLNATGRDGVLQLSQGRNNEHNNIQIR
jgi:hypothetical protein